MQKKKEEEFRAPNNKLSLVENSIPYSFESSDKGLYAINGSTG